MNAEGSEQTRLTYHPACDDQPRWSPDGTRIVFISNRDGNFELYLMDADGTNQTRLTNNPANDAHIEPAGIVQLKLMNPTARRSARKRRRL